MEFRGIAEVGKSSEIVSSNLGLISNSSTKPWSESELKSQPRFSMKPFGLSEAGIGMEQTELDPS